MDDIFTTVDKNFSEHVDFAQDLVAVIRKHGVSTTDITFRIPKEGAFEQTRLSYYPGRHGALGTMKIVVTTVLDNIEEKVQRD